MLAGEVGRYKDDLCSRTHVLREANKADHRRSAKGSTACPDNLCTTNGFWNMVTKRYFRFRRLDYDFGVFSGILRWHHLHHHEWIDTRSQIRSEWPKDLEATVPHFV